LAEAHYPKAEDHLLRFDVGFRMVTVFMGIYVFDLGDALNEQLSLAFKKILTINDLLF
jgi:hypothetical protein